MNTDVPVSVLTIETACRSSGRQCACTDFSRSGRPLVSQSSAAS